jgi:hypothetical protein
LQGRVVASPANLMMPAEAFNRRLRHRPHPRGSRDIGAHWESSAADTERLTVPQRAKARAVTNPMLLDASATAAVAFRTSLITHHPRRPANAP